MELAFIIAGGWEGIREERCGRCGSQGKGRWYGVVKVKRPKERTYFESSLLTKEERRWEARQGTEMAVLPFGGDSRVGRSVTQCVPPLRKVEDLRLCSLCQGRGSMLCFDCAGMGAHPVIRLEGHTAGGHMCRMCQGAQVIACPVCCAAEYKWARANSNERIKNGNRECEEAVQVARIVSESSDNRRSSHNERCSGLPDEFSVDHHSNDDPEFKFVSVP